MYMCVRVIDLTFVSKIFLLDFATITSVELFVFSFVYINIPSTYI